ncbi:Na+/H+ antiporter, subunit C [Modestobacter italicus]|uniref:Na+/H+ antiporter, subunit C n=1 Tax=Modestobacter italicus (strain DSM 44449 / CECT 9708 / BC 501) TaxID=2732864 RepID=I4EYG6_MODI5|nr:sodium:proton antiporter [Modestobacter marinus]CCH88429.1 Na+/H+ antiporter, subunit C [Modestobacter marinus]
MILAFAVGAAALFGCGAYLLLHRDLFRVIGGIALISQAATLTLIASALTRGQAPIAPDPDRPVSDPVPQALALTALVIGLATLALLLALVHRLAVVLRTARHEELAALEAEHQRSLERDRQRDRDEAT